MTYYVEASDGWTSPRFPRGIAYELAGKLREFEIARGGTIRYVVKQGEE